MILILGQKVSTLINIVAVPSGLLLSTLTITTHKSSQIYHIYITINVKKTFKSGNFLIKY